MIRTRTKRKCVQMRAQVETVRNENRLRSICECHNFLLALDRISIHEIRKRNQYIVVIVTIKGYSIHISTEGLGNFYITFSPALPTLPFSLCDTVTINRSLSASINMIDSIVLEIPHTKMYRLENWHDLPQVSRINILPMDLLRGV